MAFTGRDIVGARFGYHGLGAREKFVSLNPSLFQKYVLKGALFWDIRGTPGAEQIVNP